MNKQLFFLIMACSLFVLSIIAINVAPIISKANNSDDIDWSEWANQNCQNIDDDYKYRKSNHMYDDPTSKPFEEDVKRRINECKRHKVMFGLEYSAFVIDISLGFLCSFLGLFHFLEPGKSLEKISGLIGVFVGIITAAITIVYLVFSGMIFSNEPVRSITILYPNKASLKYNGKKYVFDYDYEKSQDEDHDIKYIKYKDLGKKQYNYDTEFFKIQNYYNDTDYSGCKRDPEVYYLGQNGEQLEYPLDGEMHKCDYIWSNNIDNKETNNKYLYDRWITCIILSAVIALCGIGLLICGFLLFKSEGDSGSSPIPQ